MARAGPSRSQKATQASQPSQSQRPRRGRDAAHEEDDDGEEEEQGDMAIDADIVQNSTDAELARKANDLVRLALFTEHRRVPLRRDEISKKVLGSNTRSFNIVLAEAQKILRKTFGMELVELRSRAGLDNEANAEGEADEGRTGLKKRTAAAGSKTFILRSVLDSTIIEYAALTDEQILEEEAVDMPDNDEDEDSFRSYGSIISWSSADQLGPIGILYVILALILVNNRVISDMDLRVYLKRLRLTPTASLSFNSISTHKSITVDSYLTQLTRQGYLDRQRVGDHNQKGGKRGRAPAATQAGEDGVSFEWRWGGRAQSEIGELGIARFAAEFMVERSGADDEGEDERDGKGGKRVEESQKRVETVLKGVQRAAGGNLSDVK